METRIEYSPKAMVRIRKGQGRSLKAGGAWIYDNEMESVNGAFENGDMVTVEDFDGYPLVPASSIQIQADGPHDVPQKGYGH